MRSRNASPQTRALLDAFLSQPAGWRHGYELAKSTGLSSGALYPILMRLHGRGLLEARWEPSEAPGRPARHAYRLSPDGQAYVGRSPQQRPSPRHRLERSWREGEPSILLLRMAMLFWAANVLTRPPGATLGTC